MMQKPDVDQIDGLSPAISIEQKTTSKNPRSTVGTVTEIYDYMRLLWARVGVPYSPATGLPIESQTVSQMVDRVLALPEGTRIYVLAPVVRGRKGEYKKELAEFLRKGYQRVKIDGAFYEIGEAPALDKKFTHDIDVVVDRLVVKADIGTRLADSLEQCLKLADGLAVVELADRSATLSSTSPLEGEAQPKRQRKAGGKRGKQEPAQEDALRPTLPLSGEGAGVHGEREPAAASGKAATKIRSQHAGPERLIFSEKFACPVSGFTIPEIEPRLFSFNNPFGACPECGGLGVEQHIDAELVIPDRDATLRKGAIAPWAKSVSPYYIQTLTALAKHYRFTLDSKWKDLPKKTQDAILYGSGEDEIKFVYDDGLRGYTTKKPFEGVITNLGAPLQGNRERVGARGPAEIFHRRALRGLPRRAPQARGAVRQDRRQEHLAGRRAVGAQGRRLVHRNSEAAQRPAERDRRPRAQGNPRAAALPGRRRPRLPDAGARLRHALRRREPAHPPRLADRLAASPACSTCSTSPRSACTSATMRACSKP